MKKLIDYLDEAKKVTGSDYATAKKMGVERGTISNYRCGRSSPDEYGVFQLAEILGMEERDLFIALEAQKEKNPTKRHFWEKLAGASMGFIFAVNIFVTPTQAEAAPTLNRGAQALYIM